jgi:hypothetical protein
MNYANYGWDFGGVDDYTSSGTSFRSSELISKNLKGTREISSFSSEYNLESIIGDLKTNSNDPNPVAWDILIPEGSPGIYMLWQLADGIILGLARVECTKEHWLSHPQRCLGFIDVNGTSLPNKLLTCEDENKTKSIRDEDYEKCTISDKDLGDMIPITFYDQTVIPATNAAKALLNGK